MGILLTFQQVYQPVGDNLLLSALVAGLPLYVLFVMLAVLRLPAWICAIAAMLTAAALGWLVWGMPLGITAGAATEGMAFGLWPISWIVLNAIFFHNLTVASGDFEAIKQSLTRLTEDRRLQTLLVAFSFGALLEGASVWVYGQGQSHLGLKADSGYLFVLQDILNTGMYAAHGGTISVWDSGSRFAVAGQNKVTLPDGRPAAGFKSIHFGTPNEYAFEYLMAGGDNSLHVVMGFRKPDARGELTLKPRPYSGKFFMSGAAAGRVFVFDPFFRLEPGQYHGNVIASIGKEEWTRDLGPFIVQEARRRGAPIRVEGDRWTYRAAGQPATGS